MATRYFALAFGLVFLVVGIAGFVPALMTPYSPADPNLALSTSSGYLFGLFPVNVLHNLVHIAFGIWGIAAWRSFTSARMYGKSVAVIYAVLAVMGMIPLLRSTFGLIPLHGHDIWLHIALAAVAAYFGFAKQASPVTSRERQRAAH